MLAVRQQANLALLAEAREKWRYLSHKSISNATDDRGTPVSLDAFVRRLWVPMNLFSLNKANPKQTFDWRSVKDWQTGRIRSNAKGIIWIALLFGIVFIGLSLPAVLAIPDELQKGNKAILLVLMFPVVGVVAMVTFLRALLAWRTFGVTELILDPLPGSLGGDFGGRIETNIPYRPENEFKATLNCQRKYTTGSGKERSTSTRTIWQREGLAHTRRGLNNKTELQIRFSVPGHLPATERPSSDFHLWTLQVECKLPGIDFNRSFMVPVVDTGRPLRSSLDIPYVKDAVPLLEVPSNTVQISSYQDGLRFYYPWHRYLLMSVLLIVFGTAFAAFGWLAGQHGAASIIPVSFGIMGGMSTLVGLLVIGNTLTTTVTSDGIETVRKMYGIPFRKRLRIHEISKLERISGGEMQTGAKTTVYHAIRVLGTNGRQIIIADALKGSRQADFIENNIRAILWPDRQDDDKR